MLLGLPFFLFFEIGNFAFTQNTHQETDENELTNPRGCHHNQYPKQTSKFIVGL